MSRAPSFADWQFSHGIVPWVVVHDFAEYDHHVYELKARYGYAMRRIAEPMAEAMEKLVGAVAAAFDSISDAFASASDGGSQP